MVSTVNRPTPPVGYGGIERVVHLLAEELVRQGHDVTLFGRAGTWCSGRAVVVDSYDGAREVSSGRDRLDEEALFQAVDRFVTAERPDVVHDWSLENLFVRRRPEAAPYMVSLCIPQPADYVQPNLVVASAAHAAVLRQAGVPHVHYGIDVEAVPFNPVGSDRLVHVAKIASYKGQHLSMLAAALARVKLDVVGNVEGRRYHRLAIRPLASVLPGVRLLRETTDVEATLGGARALVQAPRWLEIFPLVSLQALAAGSPLISLDAGGLSEQIEDGVTGFLAHDVRSLAEAMGRAGELDRTRCRAVARERFAVDRMARDYLALYARVLDGDTW